MTSRPAVEAHGLIKRYKGKTALDGVDLEVPQGAVHGLLGPNGAGKTTTVRILATLTDADEGEARVAGSMCAHSPVKSAAGWDSPVSRLLSMTS